MVIFVIPLISFISVNENSLRCRFHVSEKEANSLNTLHGGYTSSLIDFISTVDLLRQGVNKTVSVDLATSFMRAAPVGSWVQVESRVLRSGKTLAFCEVSLHDETSGKLIAKGRHTKFILPDASSSLSS
nr:acyl coenzyme A thioesterase 13 [Hymenolepis microstoma]